jgi:hypothetical protein
MFGWRRRDIEIMGDRVYLFASLVGEIGELHVVNGHQQRRDAAD